MVIMSQIDIIMVRFLSGAKDAGYFQVAYQLSALVLFGLNAVTLTVAPYFTRLHRQGDMKKLQILATRTSQASLAFAVLCSVSIWFFGNNVIAKVYGPDFLSAGVVLSLMCGANLIQASTGASGPLLTMTGNEYATLRAAILALIVKLASNLILIPSLGATGAGISLILAMLTLNGTYWLAARKSVQINTFAFRIG
jgi:O-antigen/teichoic acid export membrane protein